MDVWLSCLEDHIAQSVEDVSAIDSRVVLAQALVRAMRQFGRAQYRYCVLNAAVTRLIGRETDDLFTSLATAYMKKAASQHGRLARDAKLPIVSFARYKSSGGEEPSFQLWLRLTPFDASNLRPPPFVLDYPRRGFMDLAESSGDIAPQARPLPRDPEDGHSMAPNLEPKLELELELEAMVRAEVQQQLEPELELTLEPLIPRPVQEAARQGMEAVRLPRSLRLGPPKLAADAWRVPAIKAWRIRGYRSFVITAGQIAASAAYVYSINLSETFEVDFDALHEIFTRRH